MGPEDLLGHGSKSDSMSPHLAGMKLPQGMRIKLKDNLSVRENTTGYCWCWVKGSLGPEGPQPRNCPAFGLGWVEDRQCKYNGMWGPCSDCNNHHSCPSLRVYTSLSPPYPPSPSLCTKSLRGLYYYYHLIDEETGWDKLSNLPKVKVKAAIHTQSCPTPSVCSSHHCAHGLPPGVQEELSLGP